MWGELDLLCPHRVPPEARGGFGEGGSALAQGQVCMRKVQIRACTTFLFCTRALVQSFPQANFPRVYGLVQNAKMIIDRNYN